MRPPELLPPERAADVEMPIEAMGSQVSVCKKVWNQYHSLFFLDVEIPEEISIECSTEILEDDAQKEDRLSPDVFDDDDDYCPSQQSKPSQSSQQSSALSWESNEPKTLVYLLAHNKMISYTIIAQKALRQSVFFLIIELDHLF